MASEGAPLRAIRNSLISLGHAVISRTKRSDVEGTTKLNVKASSRSHRARSALPCRSADTMHEKLGSSWESKVDDVVEKRHVDASRGNIRHEQ